MSFFSPSHFPCAGRITTPKAEEASRGAEGKWNKYMFLCQKTGLAYSPACSEVAGPTGGKQELTGSQKHAQGRGEELVGRAGCPHLPSYLSAPLVWRAVVGSLLSVAPFLLSLQMLKTTWKCGTMRSLGLMGYLEYTRMYLVHHESEEIHLTHLVPPCREAIFSFVNVLCFSQSSTVNACSDTGKLLRATGQLGQRRGNLDNVGDAGIATTSSEASLTGI